MQRVINPKARTGPVHRRADPPPGTRQGVSARSAANHSQRLAHEDSLTHYEETRSLAKIVFEDALTHSLARFIKEGVGE